MPDYGKRTGRDLVESLERRISASERELRRLRGGGISTFDRGDTTSQPAPVEGQVMIQYDTEKPWYFAAGEWRDFCCDLLPSGGAASYPDGVLSLTELLGYWPLTDGAAPFDDVSGLVPPSPAAFTTTGSSPTAMTQDYTPGPLTVGDAGAVAFNGNKELNKAEYLHVADVASPERFNLDGTDFALAAWFKPFPSSNVWPAAIMSNLASGGASGLMGWRLFCSYPTNEIGFAAWDDNATKSTLDLQSGSVPDDEWVHVAVVFRLNVGGVSEGELYLNGALTDTGSGTVDLGGGPVGAVVNLPGINAGFDFGWGMYPGSGFNVYSGFGAAAHAAIWGRALSGAEVSYLYLSGSPGATTAPAGSIVVTDGSGGFTTQRYPFKAWVDGA